MSGEVCRLRRGCCGLRRTLSSITPNEPRGSSLPRTIRRRWPLILTCKPPNCEPSNTARNCSNWWGSFRRFRSKWCASALWSSGAYGRLRNGSVRRKELSSNCNYARCRICGRGWRVAMAKRSLAMQLDEVVQAMLVSLRTRPEPAPDRDLASLTSVAQALRELPREEFRAELKSDLQRRTPMSEGTAASAGTRGWRTTADHHQRPRLTAITPYIIVRPAPQCMGVLKSA